MTPTDKVRAALEFHARQGDRDALVALRELDGKVLVPVEPTEIMAAKGSAFNSISSETAKDVYRQMIKASEL